MMIGRFAESFSEACPCWEVCAREEIAPPATPPATAPNTDVLTKSRREKVMSSPWSMNAEGEEYHGGHPTQSGKETSRGLAIQSRDGLASRPQLEAALQILIYLRANRRSLPGYSDPCFCKRSAAVVLMGCTFSVRNRSSAAILPTLSNSGSSLT